MVGIILISHGPMAKGMYESSKMFLGDSIEQFEYVCLNPSESPDDFSKALNEAIQKCDDGEGVIMLGDLFGGTPCNQASYLLNDHIELISGVNLPMLLEILTVRLQGKIDIKHIINVAHDSIINIKEKLENLDDEFD